MLTSWHRLLRAAVTAPSLGPSWTGLWMSWSSGGVSGNSHVLGQTLSVHHMGPWPKDSVLCRGRLVPSASGSVLATCTLHKCSLSVPSCCFGC